MIRIAIALLATLITATIASAQTGALPPSSPPSTGAPQSPTGTPSAPGALQPFGTASPLNPSTGLPTNEPTINPQTGLPSASPSTTTGPDPLKLPPPVWSSGSPPAGQPLTPSSTPGLTPGASPSLTPGATPR
jgi:hypothetical protein